MKIFIPVITIALVLFGGAGLLSAETQSAAAPGAGERSIYAYNDGDIPEVFFFPKEKARWDGTKVTMREWYMLTDLQKQRFISEYLGETGKGYRGIAEALGLDYLKALNVFSDYANDKIQNRPSTRVIDLLLEGQGIREGDTCSERK